MENISAKESSQAGVCPHTLSFFLNNPVRRIFQNPLKILNPYIEKGITVMDLGCGPGFFTIDMARLVGPEGKVIAADLQEKMLEHVRKKAARYNVEDRIRFFRCEKDRIGFKEKVDFILAFYMVHETPSPGDLFDEMKNMLNENGRILVVEPKMHVSKKVFKKMLSVVNETGFKILSYPEKVGGYSVLITI